MVFRNLDSIGYMYGVPKSTIHVGKYTIVTWIPWADLCCKNPWATGGSECIVADHGGSVDG